MKPHRLFLIIFLFALQSKVICQNNLYGQPKSIEFNTELTAGTVTFDNAGAKNIASALFYIALLIGGINIIRTMVFNPDRAKKVIINWIVGIIVYAVIFNTIG